MDGNNDMANSLVGYIDLLSLQRLGRRSLDFINWEENHQYKKKLYFSNTKQCDLYKIIYGNFKINYL